VLGKISGPLRDELTGDWWILRDEVLHILYFLTNIMSVQIKKNEMDRACGT